MTTFTWTISALDGDKTLGANSDVVTNIHWRLLGTNEDGITGETYGSQAIGEPTSGSFIEFGDLTQEIVVGWLENVMDVQSYKDRIQAQIDEKITPTTFTLPLPN